MHRGNAAQAGQGGSLEAIGVDAAVDLVRVQTVQPLP